MFILRIHLKNRAGGLGQLNLEHKRVPVYASPDAGVRCHVTLLDMYVSKLSTAAKERDFFLLPATCNTY